MQNIFYTCSSDHKCINLHWIVYFVIFIVSVLLTETFYSRKLNIKISQMNFIWPLFSMLTKVINICIWILKKQLNNENNQIIFKKTMSYIDIQICMYVYIYMNIPLCNWTVISIKQLNMYTYVLLHTCYIYTHQLNFMHM